MKIFFLSLLSLLGNSLAAQPDSIVSQVYRWAEAEVSTTDVRERRHLLQGRTHDLASLEMHANTLKPGQPLHAPHAHSEREELIIVKEGEVKMTIEGESRVLGPGSIALVMPGDHHGLENTGKEPAVFYILLYHSKAPVDLARGKQAGGSLMLAWEDVPFRETEKGGVRSFFERPTAMFERLEMHVTTLKGGIQSHPPHTHLPAEIILMLEGATEEQIDENSYRGKAGDLYFLGSETRHTIKNTGTAACTYFAFQFN
ncbi:MAG: cupin domain-containing protein [Cyclobacteriaceae bacterium]